MTKLIRFTREGFYVNTHALEALFLWLALAAILGVGAYAMILIWA